MADNAVMNFETGTRVWAPYSGGEYVLIVVAVEGDSLVLKCPGADAGTIIVPRSKCYPSNRAPHALEDIK